MCGIDRSAIALLWVSTLSAPATSAADPVKPQILDEPQLAGRIDQHVALRLKDTKVTPAPGTDDAEFVRRLYLDLAGRIPNILEVCDFLDDDRPDKRRLIIDVLLRGKKTGQNGTTYSDHFARVWREWLLGGAESSRAQQVRQEMERWLGEQLKINVPYDRLVRTILESTDNGGPSGAYLFSSAREFKPEDVATATSRVFLGFQLDCAQCHDDRSGGAWSREQFWQFAAFFTPERRIAIPGTKKLVAARFLDGGVPAPERSGRKQLAEWLTRGENRAFARATVNRLWSYFFAVGLVEPLDGGGDHNPPSHPELMEELATQFVNHGHDVKYLMRSILLSETYQRTSRQSHAGQADARLFAKMPVRGLSATQLLASLMEVGEMKGNSGAILNPLDDTRPGMPLEQLASRFSNLEQGAEARFTILQALHLMNGPFLARITDPDRNAALAVIADAPGIDTARRVEQLYLVSLSRRPTAAEAKSMAAYLDRGGPTKNSRRAVADVLWVLLNSAEFLYNH